MGCAYGLKKQIVRLEKDQIKYDFSFPDAKSAAIGHYFLTAKAKSSFVWDKFFQKYKFSKRTLSRFLVDLKARNALKKVILTDPPNKKRWKLWRTYLRVSPCENYQSLSICKNASEDIILKDMHRTFPNYPYFNKERFGYYGQYALYRVLGKFATQYPTVGYCQGMNYIIGYLLMISGGREQEVYELFLSLSANLNLFQVFSEEMQELHKILWVFDKLFYRYFPKLYIHFEAEEITADMWIFKWILSLFTSCMPLEIVSRFWDIIIVKGLKGILQISFGIISMLELEVLAKDLTGILFCFENLAETTVSPHVFIRSALKFKIKQKRLEKLLSKYSKHSALQASLLSVPKKEFTEIFIEKPKARQLFVQEIRETLDDLPPFISSRLVSAMKNRTPQANSRKNASGYYQMGRFSFSEDKTVDDDVNAEQFLDDLVDDKTPTNSFLTSICGNKSVI